MSCFFNFMGLRFSRSRAHQFLDFLADLHDFSISPENVSVKLQLDVRNIFCRLRYCVRLDGEDYICFGVRVPASIRHLLDDLFRDISIQYSPSQDYGRDVICVFFAIIDVICDEIKSGLSTLS